MFQQTVHMVLHARTATNVAQHNYANIPFAIAFHGHFLRCLFSYLSWCVMQSRRWIENREFSSTASVHRHAIFAKHDFAPKKYYRVPIFATVQSSAEIRANFVWKTIYVTAPVTLCSLFKSHTLNQSSPIERNYFLFRLLRVSIYTRWNTRKALVSRHLFAIAWERFVNIHEVGVECRFIHVHDAHCSLWWWLYSEAEFTAGFFFDSVKEWQLTVGVDIFQIDSFAKRWLATLVWMKF